MLSIKVDDEQTVSARLDRPPDATALYVFAHGAGAGMDHAFMAAMAAALSARRVAVLRFQFPYMEQGAKRPDRPAVAHATIRAAVAEARRLAPTLPLFAGGKSFGGRMSSQAQAVEPLDGVQGLVFLGFPLHPTNKPSDERAAHLAEVDVPMLFVQGSRDALADLALLTPIVAGLGARATLSVIEGADHSFRVPAKILRAEDVVAGIADRMANWIERRLTAS
jgi:predicted alpha/beta-hydrolase family hydrolase